MACLQHHTIGNPPTSLHPSQPHLTTSLLTRLWSSVDRPPDLTTFHFCLSSPNHVPTGWFPGVASDLHFHRASRHRREEKKARTTRGHPRQPSGCRAAGALILLPFCCRRFAIFAVIASQHTHNSHRHCIISKALEEMAHYAVLPS